MSVIAKFFVQKVDKPENSPSAIKIEMGAVCRGVENASWASATPWGTIVLGTLNEKAGEYFEQGGEYEVTFRRVTKPEPGDGHQISPVNDKWSNLLCATCGMHVGNEKGTTAHAEMYGKPVEADTTTG